MRAGTRGSARRRSRESRVSAPPYPVSVSRRQLPNALTIARLLLLPVYIVLISDLRGRSLAGRPRSSSASPASRIRSTASSLAAGMSSPRSARSPTRSADRLLIDAAVLLLLARRPTAVGGAPDPGSRSRPAGRHADRARPRLRLRGQLARQDRHLAALCEPRVRHGHAPGTDWPMWLFWVGLGSRSSRWPMYARKARTEAFA